MSKRPAGDEDDERADSGSSTNGAPSFRWKKNLVLFVATAASVFATGVLGDASMPDGATGAPGATSAIGVAPGGTDAAASAVTAATPSSASSADGAFGGVGAIVHALVAGLHSPTTRLHGAQFAGALLLILLAHEFGHYFAARAHKVDASLPFFIPMPLLSPFGTMGAVIRMRDTIKTRTALLDIGAAGPLAGLVFAVPLYIWGAAHSTLIPLADPAGAGGAGGSGELGESIALKLFDHLAGAVPPEGMDVLLSPVAFAAWAGLFVTMINLIPAAQLDGGHVAYALFGRRQNDYARVVHRSMLAFFFIGLAGFVLRDVRAGFGWMAIESRFGAHVGSSLFWLVWFEALAVLGAIGRTNDGPASRRARFGLGRHEGRDGTKERPELGVKPRIVAMAALLVFASIGRDHGTPFLWVTWFAALGLLLAMEAMSGALRNTTLLDHPPTEHDAETPLGPVRRAVAIGTLIVFPLLFMPTPISM